MAEKNNKKQVQNILKDLNKTGKRLESVFGLMESAMAATTDAAKASNKIVNDKFKTLTNTLKLQKESNGYYKAANDVTKKLSDNSKKLTKSEKEQLELHRKQLRVMGKIDAAAPHEVMLVLDAGTGQNALNQAEQFNQAMQLTGISLTKLDGTAKGGVIFAIAHKLGLPIRFIGVGEGIEDLRAFKANDFVNALFDKED